MSQPPQQPEIFHIVHVDRLASIASGGSLRCDSSMRAGPQVGTTIGMGTIKHERLNLPVHCHPGDRVGDFVPFYFCSRSIMLYVIHRANHPELVYRGGQGPIVHLQADLHEAVAWANSQGRRWAFTTSNAGARYTSFYKQLDDLERIRLGRRRGAQLDGGADKGGQAVRVSYAQFISLGTRAAHRRPFPGDVRSSSSDAEGLGPQA